MQPGSYYLWPAFGIARCKGQSTLHAQKTYQTHRKSLCTTYRVARKCCSSIRVSTGGGSALTLTKPKLQEGWSRSQVPATYISRNNHHRKNTLPPPSRLQTHRSVKPRKNDEQKTSPLKRLGFSCSPGFKKTMGWGGL